jgi:DNA-binding transcriptional ArsR family regulator
MLIMKRAELEDRVFRALADSTRRSMLARMVGGEHTVKELTERFDISQPAISQHLKILREAKLVRERKEGRHTYYVADGESMLVARRWLDDHISFWTESLERLGAHLRKRHGRKD